MLPSWRSCVPTPPRSQSPKKNTQLSGARSCPRDSAPLIMFEGTFTALVSPFRDDRLDEDAFTRLIEGQIAAGITGIVPVGTTGESPTLDHAEHLRVIELGVTVARGRCLVMAGTGSNSTREAIELTQAAEKLGADA